MTNFTYECIFEILKNKHQWNWPENEIEITMMFIYLLIEIGSTNWSLLKFNAKDIPLVMTKLVTKVLLESLQKKKKKKKKS